MNPNSTPAFDTVQQSQFDVQNPTNGGLLGLIMRGIDAWRQSSGTAKYTPTLGIPNTGVQKNASTPSIPQYVAPGTNWATLYSQYQQGITPTLGDKQQTDTTQQDNVNPTNASGLEMPDYSTSSSQNGSNPYAQSDAATQAAIQALANMGVNMDTLINRVVSDSGTLQSGQNDINNFVKQAIDLQTKAMGANRQMVNDQFQYEYDYTLQKLQNQRSAALSQTRGGGYSATSLRMIDQTIEKSLRDLESRRDEAIMNGDMQAYSKISDLMMQNLTFQQQAKRDNLQSLLGVGSLMNQQANTIASVAEMTRNMNKDQIDYTLSQDQLKVSQANSMTEAANAMSLISARQAESDKSQNALWGSWKDSGVMYQEQSNAATTWAGVASQLDSGTPASEVYANTIQQVLGRVQALKGFVSADDVLATYGFAPGSDLEHGQMTVYGGKWTLSPAGVSQNTSDWWSGLKDIFGFGSDNGGQPSTQPTLIDTSQAGSIYGDTSQLSMDIFGSRIQPDPNTGLLTDTITGLPVSEKKNNA